MGNGIGVVVPPVNGAGHEPWSEIGNCTPMREARAEKPLAMGLLEAAQNYLRVAGIEWFRPVDLEVRDIEEMGRRGLEVLLHGAPESGSPILVCSYAGGIVSTYL